MQITYLYHSGYMVELKTAYFLFDYYKGEIPELNPGKPLVVFVSHSHADHYNREIYELLKDYPKTEYVLAKDIPVKRLIAEYEEQGIPFESHIHSIRKNIMEEMSLWNGRNLKITTLKSTDAGVAYVLEYEGKTIYHAGDLNLWYWDGETKQELGNMTARYHQQMEKLKGKEIDVAFVPLDPRLGEHAGEGLEIFLEYSKTKHVFPMHMWDKYEICQAFLEQHPEYKDVFHPIERNGQQFYV